MFQNFQAWKLHSFWDYMTFLLPLLIGAAIFWVVIRKIYNRRNDAYARGVVKKKLKFPEQQAKVYHNVTLSVGGETLHYDHLLIDAAGIVALRSIGWGTRVYGAVDQPIWKVADNKTETTIENPVTKLTDTFAGLRRILAAQGAYGLTVEPLVVFADPFATPDLYLGRDSNCITFTALPEWKKQRKLRAEHKSQKADIAAIANAIEAAIQVP